jgi:hypothetical protein
MALRTSCVPFAVAVFAFVLLATVPPDAQASHGNYCGGEGLWNPGQPVSLTEWCQQKYGSTATAVVVRQDAYGSVCRIPGKPDAEIDVQNACRDESLAALVGVGPNDWRCLRPQQLSRNTIPLLLLPASHVKATETAYVFQALRRIEYLMSGVRHFYRTHAYVGIIGTNAFVLPTATSASEWRSLAPTGDGAGWLQSAYQGRVLQEYQRGGWAKFKVENLVRIAAFVALGTPGKAEVLAVAICGLGAARREIQRHHSVAANCLLASALGLRRGVQYGWPQYHQHAGL